MSRYDRTVTIDVEDFYSIVNALRDSCGCVDCQRIANNLIEQGRGQGRESA
jgi:hypothetical protein